MEVREHIAAIAREGQLFATAAERCDFDAPIPTCPEWAMRDLVQHLGGIHLWAAGHVGKTIPESWDADLVELAGGSWPSDEDLVDWYLSTNANLVRVLESAPPDLECFTFLPAPSPVAMWARRQASEIAIHRFDAESASGVTTGFDPLLAADCLDELLCGFAPLRGGRLKVTREQTLHVHAQDTGDDWHLSIGPEVITTSRRSGPADLTLTGTAADLYLVLWNRAEDSRIAFSGDSELLNVWHRDFLIRWT